MEVKLQQALFCFSVVFVGVVFTFYAGKTAHSFEIIIKFVFFYVRSPAARQRRRDKEQIEIQSKCCCQGSMSIKSSPNRTTSTQTAEQVLETDDLKSICPPVNESKQLTTKARSFIIDRRTCEQSKTRTVSMLVRNTENTNTTTSLPLETTIKNEPSRQISTIDIDFDDWARIYLFGTEHTTGLPRVH